MFCMMNLQRLPHTHRTLEKLRRRPCRIIREIQHQLQQPRQHGFRDEEHQDTRQEADNEGKVRESQ